MKQTWPDDADGDVFRGLQKSGFNFDRLWTIDFVIEFDGWPPAPAALEILAEFFGNVRLHEDDGASDVDVSLEARLTYDL